MGDRVCVCAFACTHEIRASAVVGRASAHGHVRDANGHFALARARARTLVVSSNRNRFDFSAGRGLKSAADSPARASAADRSSGRAHFPCGFIARSLNQRDIAGHHPKHSYVASAPGTRISVVLRLHHCPARPLTGEPVRVLRNRLDGLAFSLARSAPRCGGCVNSKQVALARVPHQLDRTAHQRQPHNSLFKVRGTLGRTLGTLETGAHTRLNCCEFSARTHFHRGHAKCWQKYHTRTHARTSSRTPRRKT